MVGAMPSGSYFTDPLVTDVEKSPNEHGPAAGKGSRTKNFRDEEVQQGLCSAGGKDQVGDRKI